MATRRRTRKRTEWHGKECSAEEFVGDTLYFDTRDAALEWLRGWQAGGDAIAAFVEQVGWTILLADDGYELDGDRDDGEPIAARGNAVALRNTGGIYDEDYEWYRRQRHRRKGVILL